MLRRKNNSTTQYFQLLVEKKITDAEKTLEQIKQESSRSESGRGYMKCLEGLLLAYRSSNDRYLYFNRTPMTSKHAAELKREFREQTANELQSEYDKGYFKALTDFTRTIGKLRPWTFHKTNGSSRDVSSTNG